MLLSKSASTKPFSKPIHGWYLFSIANHCLHCWIDVNNVFDYNWLGYCFRQTNPKKPIHSSKTCYCLGSLILNHVQDLIVISKNKNLQFSKKNASKKFNLMANSVKKYESHWLKPFMENTQSKDFYNPSPYFSLTRKHTNCGHYIPCFGAHQ